MRTRYVATTRPAAPKPRRAFASRSPRATPAPAAVSPPASRLSDEAFARAVESAKLDAMKELAYGASHEINNPLANIAARAQTLLKREANPESRRMLEAIHRQAMRAHEMISDLMLFARPPRLERAPLDLAALVAELAEEARPLADQRSIRVHALRGAEPLVICADRIQLSVAIKALLENAIEAIGSDGEVAIATRTAESGGPRLVEIEVRDTGPGVSPEARAHLFDPFYSGREAGRGLGFGLSKCWRIVTDHGGRVTVDSPPAQGAVFTVRLPRG